MFAKSPYDVQTHLFRKAENFPDLEDLLDRIFPDLPFLYKIQYEHSDLGLQTIESTKDLILFYERQHYNLDLILLTINPQDTPVLSR